VPHRAELEYVTSYCTAANALTYAALQSVLLGSLQHGACTIQPSKIAFSTAELARMVHKCGLNRLNQFATFLANHIRNAGIDPKAAALLRSFDEVLYSGLPLAAEAEKWAYENGVRLKVPPLSPLRRATRHLIASDHRTCSEAPSLARCFSRAVGTTAARGSSSHCPAPCTSSVHCRSQSHARRRATQRRRRACWSSSSVPSLRTVPTLRCARPTAISIRATSSSSPSLAFTSPAAATMTGSRARTASGATPGSL
jgi:hypothetical protein